MILEQYCLNIGCGLCIVKQKSMKKGVAIFLILLGLAGLSSLNAQEYKYCIGIMQGYDSWSHCGAAPGYDGVRIRVNGKDSLYMDIEKKDLNQKKYFDYTIKGTSLLDLKVDGKKIESIEAFYCNHFSFPGGWKNISTNFKQEEFVIGQSSPKTESLKTDCSYWHTQTRVWSTTLYIDDPVHISSPQVPPSLSRGCRYKTTMIRFGAG